MREYVVLVELEVGLSERLAEEIKDFIYQMLRRSKYWKYVCDVELDYEQD